MDKQFNFITESTHSYWKVGVEAGPSTLMPYAVFHGPSGLNSTELEQVHFDPNYEAQTLKRFILKTAPLDNDSYYSAAGGNLNNTFLLNIDTSQLYTAQSPTGTYSFGYDYKAIGKSCSYFKSRRDSDTYPTSGEGVYDIPVPIRGAPLEFRKVYFEGKDPNIPSSAPDWAYSETYDKWSLYSASGTTVNYEAKIYRSLEDGNQGNRPSEYPDMWETFEPTNRYFAYFLCSKPIKNNICTENFVNTRDENEQWELGEDTEWKVFDIGSAGGAGQGRSGCSSAFTNISGNEGRYTASGCDFLGIYGTGGVHTTLTIHTGISGVEARLYIDYTGMASGGSGCPAFSGFSGDEGTYVVTTGCDMFGVLGSGGIHTKVTGNNIYISYTGTSSGCPAFSGFSGDEGTYVVTTGCDMFGVLGSGGIHTKVTGNNIYISYTGTSSGCPAFSGFSGDEGTYVVTTGCDMFGVLGSGDIHTLVTGNNIYISYTGTSSCPAFSGFSGDEGTYVVTTGCEMFGVLGSGGIHTQVTGNNIYISYTGCPSGINRIVSDDGDEYFSGCSTLHISGCSGLKTTMENDLLTICYTGATTGCFSTGEPIKGTWYSPDQHAPGSTSYCDYVSGPNLVDEPTLRVVPRHEKECTFFDLSGDINAVLSGVGYEQKYVGLCNADGTVLSGWVLFKGCDNA